MRLHRRARMLLHMTIAAIAASTIVVHGAAATVAGTDPNDIPTGSADILASSKWNITTAAGVRKVVFRVDFEAPPSEVYALTRVRIDTRGGPAYEGVITVDIGSYATGRRCSLYVDGRNRSCDVRTRSGTYTTRSTELWWSVAVRRSLLAPIDRIRWFAETDADSGPSDRAPDTGWYRDPM